MLEEKNLEYVDETTVNDFDDVHLYVWNDETFNRNAHFINSVLNKLEIVNKDEQLLPLLWILEAGNLPPDNLDSLTLLIEKRYKMLTKKPA